MAEPPQIHGSMRSRVLPREAEAKAILMEEQLDGLAARGFRELRWEDLTRYGTWYLHADGGVWTRAPGEPRRGRSTALDAFARGSDGTAAWFRPASEVGGPATVAELEEREQRKHKAAEAQRAEHVKQREAKAARALPVTVAISEPALPPTLRGMVERIGTLGGKVELSAGRLVVSLPPSELGAGRVGVRIAHQLYVAEAELLGNRTRDGAIDPAKVPDRALLPSGKLAP